MIVSDVPKVRNFEVDGESEEPIYDFRTLPVSNGDNGD